MASLQDLQDALRAADAAGNKEDAGRLADAIVSMQATKAPAVPSAAPSPAYHAPIKLWGGQIPESAAFGPSAGQRAAMPAQWQNASALDRMKLMMQAAPNYAVASNLGTAQMGANTALPAVGATVGQQIGQRVPIPGAAIAGRFIGGAAGDLAAQSMGQGMAQSGGQAPQPLQYGRALGTGVASMFGAPSLANATVPQVAKAGLGMGAANLAGKAVETGVDEGRAPTLAEGAKAFGMGAAAAPMAAMVDSGSGAVDAKTKEAQAATNTKILKEGQRLGYAVPPSFVKTGLAANTVESYAGKAATAQQAIQKNQPVTNQLVRDWLDLPETASLDQKTIDTARAGPNMIYDKVSKISPQASLLLDQYKQAKSDSRFQHYQYESQMSGNRLNPETLEKARLADASAAQHLRDIETEGRANGHSGITTQLKAAEEKLAKLGVAEKGIAGQNGKDISASIFSEPEAKGFTGEAKTIGQFYDAFDRVLRDAASSPSPGVNKLSTMVAGGAGVLGAMKYGAPGAAAAVLPYMMEGPTRQAMLSKFYQQNFVNPNFGPQSLDVPASLARFGVQAAGRAQPSPATLQSFAPQ